MVRKMQTFEIVGVVGDTLYDVTQPLKAMIYFPIFSGVPSETSGATIVVRTTGDPLSLSLPVQKQVSALDPALPVYEVLTLPQIVGNSTANQSFSATLVLAFALLSLVACCHRALWRAFVSGYAACDGDRDSHCTGRATVEVLRLVLLDGLRPVIIGLLIGLAGGATAAMFIRSILYGTSPFDPIVFATMIGSLLLTAIAACTLPAIRASRIEPMQALRAR